MAWQTQIHRRMIIDSGSYSIRFGHANTLQPLLIYNNFMAIDRDSGSKLFGPQLDIILDESKLIYQKNNTRGVTVRFETYLNMLDEMMLKMQMPRKTTGFYCQDYSITLPILPYHPRKVMQRHLEIYLEYFRYDAIFCQLSSQFIYQYAKKIYNQSLISRYSISQKYAIVLQCSQSATYITPFHQGKPVKSAIKRLDTGGKLLTNYLKQLLSFRHLDLKNSDRLIKQIKEDMCFVSMNLMEDMRCKKGTFLKHFVLPDDELKKKGYAIDILDQNIYTQHISLDKERIQIPQILFNPQDIGLEQKGIPNAILESIQFANENISHNYLQNIIITGGNTRFQNFQERLYSELKKNCAQWIKPMIYTMNNINACYQATVYGSQRTDFNQQVILKDWYKEQGPNRINHIIM